LAQGRFFSVDTCVHKVDRTFYQYARIRNTPIMAHKLEDQNFKQIFVA